MEFLDFGLIDLIDIFIVAWVLYKIYMLIRGTVAINILFVIASIYMVWVIVKAMNLQLFGDILGQFIGNGVLALIIVFQPELRRFFLYVYSENLSKYNFSIENIFSRFIIKPPLVKVEAIVEACKNLSISKTGGTIVISGESKLSSYTNSGIKLMAETTSDLIESVFFKNNPLHDGALIIVGDKIVAASCILPVSEDKSLPQNYGLRHRSALGISEATNALAIVISEESGGISYFKNSKFYPNVSSDQLLRILNKEYIQRKSSQKQNKETIFQNVDLNPFKN
ncbi:MAG: diadenylate cyclase [Bacteroidales bacterium]